MTAEPARRDFLIIKGQRPMRNFPARTFAELKVLPPREWLVKNLIPRNALIELHGQPKSRKSFFAFDLTLSIAAGIPFHGHFVRRGRITYISAENDAAMEARRIAAWLKARNVREDAIGGWEMISRAVKINKVNGAGQPSEAAKLIADLSQARPDLIVFDTLARCMVGDENSQQDMSDVVTACDDIREQTGASVLLVHHEGKDAKKGARGSSVLRGAIDTGLRCRIANGRSVVTVEDQRDGEPLPPMTFELRPVDGTGCAALFRADDLLDCPIAEGAPKPLRPESIAGRTLEFLKRTIADRGEPAPAALALPPGTKAIGVDHARELFREAGIARGQPEAHGRAFRRALDSLAGHVGRAHGFIWIEGVST